MNETFDQLLEHLQARFSQAEVHVIDWIFRLFFPEARFTTSGQGSATSIDSFKPTMDYFKNHVFTNVSGDSRYDLFAKVFVYLGIFLLALVLVYNIFEMTMGGFVETRESVISTIIKTCISAILIYKVADIITFALDNVADVAYNYITTAIAGASDMHVDTLSYGDQVLQVFQPTNGGVIAQFLGSLIATLVFAYNFVKLGIEVVQHYVMLCTLGTAAPMFMPFFINDKTSRIFNSYWKAFFTEAGLLIINRMWLEFSMVVISCTGSNITGFFIVIAFLRIGQSLNGLARNLGFTTAGMTSSLFDSVVIAAAGVATVGRSAKKTVESTGKGVSAVGRRTGNALAMGIGAAMQGQGSKLNTSAGRVLQMANTKNGQKYMQKIANGGKLSDTLAKDIASEIASGHATPDTAKLMSQLGLGANGEANKQMVFNALESMGYRMPTKGKDLGKDCTAKIKDISGDGSLVLGLYDSQGHEYATGTVSDRRSPSPDVLAFQDETGRTRYFTPLSDSADPKVGEEMHTNGDASTLSQARIESNIDIDKAFGAQADKENNVIVNGQAISAEEAEKHATIESDGSGNTLKVDDPEGKLANPVECTTTDIGKAISDKGSGNFENNIDGSLKGTTAVAHEVTDENGSHYAVEIVGNSDRQLSTNVDNPDNPLHSAFENQGSVTMSDCRLEMQGSSEIMTHDQNGMEKSLGQVSEQVAGNMDQLGNNAHYSVKKDESDGKYHLYGGNQSDESSHLFVNKKDMGSVSDGVSLQAGEAFGNGGYTGIYAHNDGNGNYSLYAFRNEPGSDGNPGGITQQYLGPVSEAVATNVGTFDNVAQASEAAHNGGGRHTMVSTKDCGDYPVDCGEISEDVARKVSNNINNSGSEMYLQSSGDSAHLIGSRDGNEYDLGAISDSDYKAIIDHNDGSSSLGDVEIKRNEDGSLSFNAEGTVREYGSDAASEIFGDDLHDGAATTLSSAYSERIDDNKNAVLQKSEAIPSEQGGSYAYAYFNKKGEAVGYNCNSMSVIDTNQALCRDGNDKVTNVGFMNMQLACAGQTYSSDNCRVNNQNAVSASHSGALSGIVNPSSVENGCVYKDKDSGRTCFEFDAMDSNGQHHHYKFSNDMKHEMRNNGEYKSCNFYKGDASSGSWFGGETKPVSTTDANGQRQFVSSLVNPKEISNHNSQMDAVRNSVNSNYGVASPDYKVREGVPRAASGYRTDGDASNPNGTEIYNKVSSPTGQKKESIVYRSTVAQSTPYVSYSSPSPYIRTSAPNPDASSGNALGTTITYTPAQIKEMKARSASTATSGQESKVEGTSANNNSTGKESTKKDEEKEKSIYDNPGYKSSKRKNRKRK